MYIVLGLGSNLGQREQYLAQACHLLVNKKVLRTLRCASLYETKAWLLPDSPVEWDISYLNTALCGETDLAPDDLLKAVKEIEFALGRCDRGRWAPREIDIDILCGADLRCESAQLVVPHRGLFERPFALLPTLEVLRELPSERAENMLQIQKGQFGKLLDEARPTWIDLAYPINSTENAEVRFAEKKSQFLFRQALPEACDCSAQLPWTELVGVMNVTPDSFSDAGQLLDEKVLRQRIEQYIQLGIRVIDIGAESTRPNAPTVTCDEEQQRLQMVFKRTAEILELHPKLRLSIDTRHASTARAALENGFHWVNDVSAAQDPEMLPIIAAHPCEYVYMHNLGVPPLAQVLLESGQALVDVMSDFVATMSLRCDKQGICTKRLIFDPGIGFGKSSFKNIELLCLASSLQKMLGRGQRMLFGHSRKSFLEKLQGACLQGRPAQDRDLETALCSTVLARQGVDYLRIHDAETNMRALRLELALFLAKKPVFIK